jgi:non-specific serine/threonine protein kinase
MYLLASQDAQKIKNWLQLCEQELLRLGYSHVELIGKGAYGFAFAGLTSTQQALVFKFTRIDLPQSIHDRLADEAYMLRQVSHPNVPRCVAFEQINKQSILVMERAPGIDLEQYSIAHGKISVAMTVSIILQLSTILRYLHADLPDKPMLIHGDIKPSNLMWDEGSQQLSLIDWGSSVFAQVNLEGEPSVRSATDYMGQALQTTNARLGDVYFIGDAQLKGALSNPGFDYQGLASTVYALRSAQGARFGKKAIPPDSLGLPQLIAQLLNALLDDNEQTQHRAIYYLNNNQYYLQQLVLVPVAKTPNQPLVPCYVEPELAHHDSDIETVVYSSRKSFLRSENSPNLAQQTPAPLKDAQVARYYKEYMQGMGETEKGFLAAVSRLAKYPVVGGLAIRWQADGVAIDSHLTLYDNDLYDAFTQALDNVVILSRAIQRKGVFKACLFDAKQTLQLDRAADGCFYATEQTCLAFVQKTISAEPVNTQAHSYFEDGDDPDELLTLPEPMLHILQQMNDIHHSGCIIFEVYPTYLKIHHNLTLFDPQKALLFRQYLDDLLTYLPLIKGEGMSGFMKLAHKDTRFFGYQDHAPEHFYPRNINALRTKK